MKHEWHTGKSDDLVETIIKVERQKKGEEPKNA